MVSWAFARVGVHRLSLPYLGVIPSTLLHLPLDFIRVSSLRPTYLHPAFPLTPKRTFLRPKNLSKTSRIFGLGVSKIPVLSCIRPFIHIVGRIRAPSTKAIQILFGL